MEEKIYACIDLKCFYASVEAVERGLDPFCTNLVVADPSRGRGAICLAITPAMKALGVQNRCRIYEIPKGISYITAMPQMKKYMEYAAQIYGTYLRFLAKEDIFVYSIDECFLDLTPYKTLYKMEPRALVKMLMDAVFEETGIAASAGIGTNLFLAKVALDITAKHAPDRIAFLDEARFQETLWHHTPLTDFWNIGRGIARRLEKYGLCTLWGVAHTEEAVLYREFGINARYLIDHAWGREPCSLQEIQAYTPSSTSISQSQILFTDYGFSDGLLILKEMVTELCMELIERKMETDSVALSVGYSRDVRPAAGGSKRLPAYTDSGRRLSEAFCALYKEKVSPEVPIRKISVSLGRLTQGAPKPYDMFMEYQKDEQERRKLIAMQGLKRRFGKNAVFKGMSLEEKATGIWRNTLIGGHYGGI